MTAFLGRATAAFRILTSHTPKVAGVEARCPVHGCPEPRIGDHLAPTTAAEMARAHALIFHTSCPDHPIGCTCHTRPKP